MLATMGVTQRLGPHERAFTPVDAIIA